MNLEDRDLKEKRERRKSMQQRPLDLQSLPSISTFTGELLDSLKEPGLLNDDGRDDTEKREAVIRWRETSGVPSDTGAAQRMKPSSISRMEFLFVPFAL
jgi:hypothetical protein